MWPDRSQVDILQIQISFQKYFRIIRSIGMIDKKSVHLFSRNNCLFAIPLTDTLKLQ